MPRPTGISSFFNACCSSLMCWPAVDDWEAIGCYNNFDHAALPVHFYTPADLDVNELWPNLKPLVEACSKQAEKRNYSCFGIQYQHECWGGTNASLTYDISGKSRNCRVDIDNYGVGKLYTSFVYKLKPVNGNWSPWSLWGSCSKTCDEGFQKRMRECSDPAPTNGGKVCMGEAIESKKCLLKLCPVNGNWSPWSSWGPCSKTCDGGFQKRMRECSDPVPANGGKACMGEAIETKKCLLKLCPVDGNWSAWSSWVPCSKTCGGDLQTRKRRCTNPAPANSGKPCQGVAKETKGCNVKECPVNGNWSPWSAWSSCSKTRDDGLQRRMRECKNPAPVNDGDPCKGNASEVRTCSLQFCPVNGQWGSWQAWSACSVSCRGGVQRRKRSCNNPSPAHDGTDCIGVSMVTRSCNLTPCPVHGGWSPWNNWSRCERTCGGGTQLRYRTCTHPPPQHSGKPCVGQGSRSRSCNTHSCPSGRRLVLCENNMARVIKCGLFRRIRVHWVHYGYIEGDRACGTTYKNTCSSQKAVRVLKRWCEGKFFCLVRPWNKFFQAPCGNRKYLKVYYSC
ncbi:coadhesin-like isoform X4 [Stylophora pistillata]|uniref:coadhesin-like isoform X4 n=1 Tax=Stylophora pistillata TaxID=50429 RepID=UPI000C04A959|nr:coadhesin-like isoform X4 [Stylophora pistillata]